MGPEVSKIHPNAPIARKVNSNAKAGVGGVTGLVAGPEGAKVGAGGAAAVGGKKTGPKMSKRTDGQ